MLTLFQSLVESISETGYMLQKWEKAQQSLSMLLIGKHFWHNAKTKENVL